MLDNSDPVYDNGLEILRLKGTDVLKVPHGVIHLDYILIIPHVEDNFLPCNFVNLPDAIKIYLEFIDKVNHERVIPMCQLILPDSGALLLAFQIEAPFCA